MKNAKSISFGIGITIVIYLISVVSGRWIDLKHEFFTGSFATHTFMMVLSILLLYKLKKQLKFSLNIPEFKKMLKPFLLGFLTTVFLNITITILSKMLGQKIEAHPLFSLMTPLQIVLFVFIYASIAEELLFRGFLVNYLNRYFQKTYTLFNRKISLAVIISAVMFGLAHLSLLSYGLHSAFLFRIVFVTITLGIIAGYYQKNTLILLTLY